MRLKHYIWSLMALLAMATSVQQPLFAENKAQQKKHKSHSSSSSNKDDKCCEKSKKLLKQINQTTMQDLVVDQTTLNVVNQINQTTRADLAVDQEILADVEQLLDCSCTCTVIEPADFMDANGVPSVTYVISESGNYCLGGDVAFEPAGPFTPAIAILANNVQLNLQGFTLSQASDNPNSDIYGVQIGQGYFYDDPNAVLSNVTVKNGSLINFTGVGVFCYNGSFDDPSFAQVPFTQIACLNLNMLNCGTSSSPDYVGSAIFLDSFAADNSSGTPQQNAFDGVIIKECMANDCFGSAAIGIYTSINTVIADTQANDLFCTDENGAGAFAYNLTCQNLQMVRCQGNGVTSVDSNSNGIVGGIAMGNSAEAYLKDCQFNDAFGETDYFIGNQFGVCTNLVVENCQFNNLQGGAGAAQVVTGVLSTTTGFGNFIEGTGIKWINCQFNGTSVDPSNTTIILLSGIITTCLKNTVFENCQACNIQTTLPNVVVAGFNPLASDDEAPAPELADANNITFRNCVASDISGAFQVYGFFLGDVAAAIAGTQVVHKNMVIENCIAERISSTTSTDDVAGIAESTQIYVFGTQEEAIMSNLYVRGCRISDVRSNSDTPSPTSAGILVSSVTNPVIVQNSISDCDRGILLTGSDEIIPNCFQLAATEEDALAFPPVFIPLDVQLQVTVSPDPDGINPIQAFYTTNGPRLTSPISAPGEVTDPSNACSTVTNDLTGEIGIVLRDGACGSGTFVLNAEAAGDVATLIISGTSSPDNFGGSPSQTKVAVAISQSDGTALLNSLNNNPGSIITIDLSPSIAGSYTFDNITQGNSVDATILQVDTSGLSFICPSADLTALGWQPGDTIFFDCNGNETIPELDCNTNYFAIVYIPGFSKNGLIQNNKIDNCSISCYQDDAPTTLSGWVDNTAFNCGAVPTQFTNYDITFAGVRPVDAGTLTAYPVGGNKYYNLSLVP